MKMTKNKHQFDAEGYDRHLQFVTEYGEDILNLLQPGPDDRVLDLGCGTGHLSGGIPDIGASVVGLETWREMIQSTPKSFTGKHYLGNFPLSVQGVALPSAIQQFHHLEQ